MKIIEDQNWRYATKVFDSSKRVSKEDMDTLVEALRLSASSFGLQPWKFVVVESQNLKDQLLPVSWNQKQVVDASHVIVLCRPKEFTAEDVERFIQSTATIRHQDPATLEGYKGMMTGFISKMSQEDLNHWMKDQVYIALGNLLAVCAQMRIDSCPMEGFSAPEYDKILGLGEKGLTSVVVCPVGYRSDEDKYGSLAKVRYSTEEISIWM